MIFIHFSVLRKNFLTILMFLIFFLQDARIGIRSMLQSPYLGDMRHEVEFWDSALQQVEEITELWFQCQKKVNIY